MAGNSHQPDSAATDPYRAPLSEIQSAKLSMIQRTMAVVIGVIVMISSMATLLAFLFGIIVAVGGVNQPGQVDPWDVITHSGMGRWILIGGGSLTVIVSVLLGYFGWRKMLLAWQKQAGLDDRRRQLTQSVESFREERGFGKTRSPGSAAD
ncbi:MAG: hypothetical protein R3C20_13965 [Planctomycetaceae bacterium]